MKKRVVTKSLQRDEKLNEIMIGINSLNNSSILKSLIISILYIVSVSFDSYAQQYPSLSFQQYSLGGSSTEDIVEIIESSDGNYVIAGTTTSSDGDIRGQHGNRDFYAIKINGITGDTLWTSRAIGGSGPEILYSAFESNDGNYMLVGEAGSGDGDVRGSNGSFDFWAIKLNGLTGDTIWTSKALGGTAQEIVKSTFESSDGNYILLGTTASPNGGDIRGQHGSNDFWAVKLNGVTGDTIWTSRAIGGSSMESMENNTCFEGIDGNYILAGTTTSPDGDVRGQHLINQDFWMVKINSVNGDTLWTSRAIGGTGGDALKMTFESSDGNYILAGITTSLDGDVRAYHSSGDIWMVKINSVNGDTLWTSKAMGGGGSELITSTFESNDGNYVLAGTTKSSDGDVRGWHGDLDFWAVKLNSLTGDTLWTSKALGGIKEEKLKEVLTSNDGNLVLVGTTTSSDGDVRGQHGKQDFWVVKINSLTGDTIRVSNAIGGNGLSLGEEFEQIKPTCDGGFLISGDTYTLIANGDVTQSSTAGSEESLWMVKIDSLFNVQWDKVWDDGNHAEEGRAYPTNDGGFLFIGLSRETAIQGNKEVIGHGGDDIWTSKIYWLDATFEADTVCPSFTTTFTDSTKGLSTVIPGVEWYWDFGDLTSTNDTSSLQNPQYTYPDSGTYWVTQVVHIECQWDTFISTVFVAPNPIANANNDTFTCNGDSITIGGNPTATGGTPGYTYSWDNGAGNQSNPSVPIGTYHLTVTDKIGCIGKDSILVTLAPPLTTATIADDTICVGESVQLWTSGNQSGLQYAWSPSTNLDNPAIDSPIATPTSTITYQVIISRCEADTNMVTIIVNTPPVLSVQPTDTIIKTGNSVNLSVLPSNLNYTWMPDTDLDNPMSRTPIASPTVTTNYTVTATDSNGCTSTASSLITIEEEELILWLPNAFSPNGDGYNDQFTARYVPINGQGIKNFTLQIYDRWGKKVYEQSGVPSSSTLVEWDGKLKGKVLNQGVYVWYIKVALEDNSKEETFMKGNVTLLR